MKRSKSFASKSRRSENATSFAYFLNSSFHSIQFKSQFSIILGFPLIYIYIYIYIFLFDCKHWERLEILYDSEFLFFGICFVGSTLTRRVSLFDSQYGSLNFWLLSILMLIGFRVVEH